MTYEELTEQATKNITDFMDRAKSAGNRHSAIAHLSSHVHVALSN